MKLEESTRAQVLLTERKMIIRNMEAILTFRSVFGSLPAKRSKSSARVENGRYSPPTYPSGANLFRRGIIDAVSTSGGERVRAAASAAISKIDDELEELGVARPEAPTFS